MEAKLVRVVKEVEKAASNTEVNNDIRKQLWSKLDIALLDAEGSEVVDPEGKILSDTLQAKIVEVRKLLKLQPVQRPKRLWYWLDIWFRFAGVCCGFFTSSLLSLPIIFMQIIDDIIGIDPFYRISETMRKFVAQFMCVLAGVVYETHGLNTETQFSAPCVIYAFTHACNLDGLLVSSTCPVRHFALAKKELFFVPFFSWISFAIGGVPVDRENRDRAIGSLNRAAKKATSSKACVVMAPEGTRSKHGNLQDYKKGMFHIQAQLNAPIVPFIIYGGFDLYPVGSWVNQCGRVAVRYLPPITSKDASNRDEMRRLCRRRVLEALADTPAGCGDDLTTLEWVWTYIVNLINFAFVYWTVCSYTDLCMGTWSMSAGRMAAVTTAGVFAITFGLFIHFTYIVHFFSGDSGKSKQG
jgi:1-acyl-sn-glycerol-3-phosphate acyltransferase